ncbi:MAG: hypothetical protein ACT4OM_07850 [Actinomycetota bacterium]
MLADLDRFASRPQSRRSIDPFSFSLRPGVVLAAIFLIGCLGAMTGSAAGLGIKAFSSGKPMVIAAASELPGAVKPEIAQVTPVLAPEPPPPAPVLAPVPAPPPVVQPKPVVLAPVVIPAQVVVAPPPVPAPIVAPPVPACSADQRLDDAKIHWLLEQSAKALAENPAQAAGAARVDAGLRSALGQNMCASEAKALIANTCADATAARFLQTMVNRLPFFIKPMIGNPCTADIVAVLNRLGSFIS